MDWKLLGNCVAALECAFALAVCVWVGVRALCKLPTTLLLALALFAVDATLTAQKTNNVPPNMNSPLPQMMQGGGSLHLIPHPPSLIPLSNPVQTTNDDISRGWRIESVTTNAAVSYAMPTNATLVGNWHIHGAASSFGNNVVDFGDWAFPLGTNDAAFSSFWYFIDGRIRPTPRDAAHEICAVGVPMSAVPGQSRLWRLDGDDGSRVLTWENFFLGGDTNSPVNAQIVLSPNGDFITRSNDVETVCRRVNPDDWDDDGIHNERDANPTICDGDFYGVANALPTNANPDAYYWLDLSATGLLGVATIRVTCDGPSDLGDHLIIAHTNQVCHIPLLAGATYAVESDLQIGYSAVSSEFAEIVTNSESRLTVSLPLEFSLVRIQTRSAGATVNYGAASSPIDVFPYILSCFGGCCSCQVAGGTLEWSCSPTCTCGGANHCLEMTALWEGYTRLFLGYAACGCGEDAPDPTPTPSGEPQAASVSASFSKDAVIFEDAYENMPGEWVSRRSTATTLTICANGGTNGAVLSVSATNLSKLQKNSGPAFPSQSVSVPAGHSITYEMNYVGLSASGTADDIEVVATLTDNATGESITNDCHATSVRLELAAVWEAPENPCTNRHVYGVGEKVLFNVSPQLAAIALTTIKYDMQDTHDYELFDGAATNDASMIRTYRCPISASYNPPIKVSYCDAEYSPLVALVEPEFIVTTGADRGVNAVDVFNEESRRCWPYGSVGTATLVTTNYIGPMTVSFRGIAVSEVPCQVEDIVTGCFTNGHRRTHTFEAGAGRAHPIKDGNFWFVDAAHIGATLEDWSPSSELVWRIPIGWHRRGESDEMFPVTQEDFERWYDATSRPLVLDAVYSQRFSIDSDGVVKVEKFGHWTTRSRHCRVVLDGNTIQWSHPLW